LTYTQQLEEWVKGATTDSYDCYLAVFNALLDLKVNKWDCTTIEINCKGLNSRPPLPTEFTRTIKLILEGQPNIPLRAFLADLPNTVKALTFYDNSAITQLSSETFSANYFISALHIINCSNFTHFVGKFTVDLLSMTNIRGSTLSLRKDNFPVLSTLILSDNRNLTSITVSEKFNLIHLCIEGNHNKLTTFPSFSCLESITIDSFGLESISDYSWHALWSFSVFTLVENHHKQGRFTATLKLIEMAEHILTCNMFGHRFLAISATQCLNALLGESATASFGPPELVLGKLFLNGVLIKRDAKKAKKFFKLALARKRNPKREEVLRKTIEFLPLSDFYQKVRLFSLSDQTTILPPELHQLILSLGSERMEAGLIIRRRAPEYW
jgi:hypothetical protein